MDDIEPKFFFIVTDSGDLKQKHPTPLPRAKAERRLASLLHSRYESGGYLEPVTDANALDFGVFRSSSQRLQCIPLGSGQLLQETEAVYGLRYEGERYPTKQEATARIKDLEDKEGQGEFL